VEIDIGQKRADASALNRTCLTEGTLAVFQHACVQPFADETQDSLVRNAVLEKFEQPSPVEGIEEATDVCVEHPVHLSRQQGRIERIQCPMGAALRTEAVREPQEVHLVDRMEHLDGGPLDDLVLQGRNAQGPLPSIRFRDVGSTGGLSPVGAALEPFGKLLEVGLQVLPIVAPRLPVYAGGGFPLKAKVGLPQRIRVVEVVHQRREPQPFILLGCTTYPPERLLHASPALCPGRGLFWRVPFGQPPSLPPLRGRYRARRFPCTPFVREVLRYYGAVRLPCSFIISLRP